jgi:hypothetical protein
MRAKLVLLALGATATLFAADTSKILLSGTSVSVEEARASGSAHAVVGELTVTAEAITFDKQKNVLRCDGAVVIRTSSGAITAHDCIVELVPGEKKVAFLTRGEIRVGPAMERTPTTLVPTSR